MKRVKRANERNVLLFWTTMMMKKKIKLWRKQKRRLIEMINKIT
jgi:radical SAM superfamily enzyme with C-terminal helix-hairpin-helix motif